MLRGLGHEVRSSATAGSCCTSAGDPPDFVFNFAEGQGIGRSREARVPAVLEMLGIPYTGSDPLTLAVTLDKDCAKRLVQSAGVTRSRAGRCSSRTRTCTTWKGGMAALHGDRKARLGRIEQGHSRQVRGGRRGRLHRRRRSDRRDQRQPVLVEEYIDGDELTVGVIGNDPPHVLGVMRVLPTQRTERFVYSLEVKRDWRNQVRYECPARLPPNHLRAVEQAALQAYRALGCRDVARVDFRLRDGVALLSGGQSAAGTEPGNQRPGDPGRDGRNDL